MGAFRAQAALILSAVYVVALSGCAPTGGGAALVPAAGTPMSSEAAPSASSAGVTSNNHRRKTKLRLEVRIPRKPHQKHGRYISPATQSVLFSISDATHTYQFSETVIDLTPGSPGCTVVSGYTMCTTSISAPLGNDTFDITTFDQTGGYGNALSGFYDYPYAVGSGATFAVGLDAIPASMKIVSLGDQYLNGDPYHGYQIAGLFPEKLEVVDFDADGYPIVGAGAPTVSLTSGSSGALSIVPSSNPNVFTMTPLKFQKTPVSITASVTPKNNVGYPMTTNLSVSMVPLLFVGNFGDYSHSSYVTAYAPWSPTPVETIPSTAGIGQIYGMVVDSSGNLFVSNFALNTIAEFAPGTYSAPTRTIPNVVANQYGMVLDAQGNLYVSSLGNGSIGSVSVYPPGGITTPSLTITGLGQPYGLAIDATGNLYVADQANNNVQVYAPGATTPSTTIANGLNGPWQVAFDGKGNLFVANFSGNSVSEFSPPFTSSSSPVRTFSSGIQAPQHLAFDSKNDLYVVNPGVNTVTEYSPTGSLIRSMSSGFFNPFWVTLDPWDNVYVASFGLGTVPVYASGTSLKPAQTLFSGMLYPSALAIWP